MDAETPPTRNHSSLDSLDAEFWEGAPSQAEAFLRLHGYPDPDPPARAPTPTRAIPSTD